MTNVVDRTRLNFEAQDVSLYGLATPVNFGWSSEDDWVVDTGTVTRNLVDTDLGPLGALHVDVEVGFKFGIRLKAGLGQLGGLDTEYDIVVNVGYDDFVVAGQEGDGVNAVFDFTDVEVISASSQSTGLGLPTADPRPGQDDPDSIPAGVSLDLVGGATFGFKNIEYRLPLSSTKKANDFFIIDQDEFTYNLFKLDVGNAKQSFELSDEISIVLRLPSGANTKGSSTGSTIVSDKGYSPNAVLAIEGDLDALVTKYLKGVPFLGQVLSVLENTVFFSEEIDLNEYIPILPEEWFKVSVSVVDILARAGLHITEEVSVDIGYEESEDLPDFQLGGGTSIIDQAADLFGLGGADPGEDKTPNVDVVLRSDNGTPEFLLDDKIARGSLGDKIALEQPNIATDSSGEVTVDAWFDVDSAKVAHSVGLGGKFSVTVTILSAAISGKVGEKLGISFGPLFSKEIPDGGLKLDLFNFFTRRFDVEGGSFENISATTDVADWNYREGAFNQQTAQYSYYWTKDTLPSGLDESDPASRKKTIAFAEANEKWLAEINQLFDQTFVDRGITDVRVFNTGVSDIVDPTFGTAYGQGVTKLGDTAAIWTGSGANLSTVRLELTENNIVIAAPSTDPALDGLHAQWGVSLANSGNRGDLLTNGVTKLQVLNFFNNTDESLKDRVVSPTITLLGGFLEPEVIYGTKTLDTNLAPNIVGTTQNDIVIFFGEKTLSIVNDVPLRNAIVYNAPIYLDGGRNLNTFNDLDFNFTGAPNTPISFGDVFLANFGASFNESAVNWDLRAEELAEIAASGGQVTQSVSGVGGTVSLSAGDFQGSRLEFSESGEVVHTTIVRDFESYLIRFGDQADTVRTSGSGMELMEFKGGNDQLIIVSDGLMDSYMMGEGDDFVIWDRANFISINPSIDETVAEFEERTADFILGGRGFDEVLISADENAPFFGNALNAGLVWSYAFNGFSSEVFDAEDSAEDLFNIAFQINAVLGSDDDAFGSIADFDGGGPLRDQKYVQFSAFGAETSVARIASDIEVINVDGFDETADLVIYTGGTGYTGGSAPEGEPQPFDTFVADFGAFEAAKTIDGVHPGGVNLNASDTGVAFADAFVGEFERLVVKGTSVDDVLIGGVNNDYLDGGLGNDTLVGGGATENGFDTLIGGRGNDTLFYNFEGITAFYADEFADPPPQLGLLDSDTVIVNATDVDQGVATLGLSYLFDDSGSEKIVTAITSFDDVLIAMEQRAAAGTYSIGYGDLRFLGVGVEHTNILGRDAGDDVLIYDGGATYIGGEREGDADLFAADFSDQVEGLEFLIEDDAASGGLMALENGVRLGGVDRMVVLFGKGIDTVRGGSLDDYIDGGADNDLLNGGAGNDVVRGGEGDDFVYWQGDSGSDIVDGGAGSDRLMVSNKSETGSGFGEGGLVIDVLNAADQFFTASAINSTSIDTDVASLLDQIDQGATWFISVAATNNVVRFNDVEAVDVQGSDEYDDAILFQGGLIYAGGERTGDADLFLANLTDETNDLTISGRDARAGQQASVAFVSIGNALDTQIGEFERFYVQTGSGEDTVTGGLLNDVFETGDGNDTINGSLGDDRADGGAGDDRFSYVGGNDVFSGGADGMDRLQIAAQDSGYSLTGFRNSEGATPDISVTINAGADVAASRSSLDLIVNQGYDQQIELSHEFGSVRYSGMEYLSTTGNGAQDVFLSGSEGGVISSDGGSDILISGKGDDFLIGGEGRDAYVFGQSFGQDIIANEFSGFNEVHFIGRDLSQMVFRTDTTGRDLIIDASFDDSLTITGYFAQSGNPQNFTFFADDALGGQKFDASNLVTTQGAGLETGAQFLGTAGNDGFEQGTGRAEFFFGFAGDDVFRGSLGADLLDGSLGNDVVIYETSLEGISIDLRNIEAATGGQAAGDIFAGIEGVVATPFADTLRGNSDGNNLIGGAGGDTLIGYGQDDLLSGGDGDDFIDPGAGNDMVFGGAGDDVIRADFDTDDGDDTIFGDEGDDTIVDLSGNNSITGGQGDDTVETGGGDDQYLYQGARDPERNQPDLNGGRDSWIAGGGTDTVTFRAFDAGVFIYTDNEAEQAGVVETSDADTYDLLGNNRILLTFEGVENTVGTEFDDVLWGSNGQNVIDGRDGNDELMGRAGADELIGAGGFDTVNYRLEGGSNGVTVDLSAQTATDSFGDADLVIEVENILGTSLSDTLSGSEQDNVFTGFDGFDIFDGREGIDTLDYSREEGTSGIIAQMDIGQISDTHGAFDSVTGIENFILTDRADLFDAHTQAVNLDIGGGDDIVMGSTQDDIVIGGLGQNEIYGRAGADTYLYGNGFDLFDGGSDVDTLSFVNSDVWVNVDVPAQIVFQFASARKLVEYTDVEQIVGSRFDDGLFGFFDADILIGWDGNDLLQGRGNDDTLFGNSGNDRLEGGEGHDTLHGGTGNDTALGGIGDDVYFYEAGLDNFDGETGANTLDFEKMQLDEPKPDALPYGIGVSSDAGEAHGLQAVRIEDAASGGDIDIASNRDLLVEFDNVATLNATDFNDIVDNVSDVSRFDTINLRGGNDLLFSQAAFGEFNGGSGFDTISYAKTQVPTTALGLEIDFVTGTVNSLDVDAFAFDRINGFEAAIGSEGVDSFIGDTKDNLFVGLGGHDSFVGGAGSDTIDYSQETGTGPLVANLFSSSVRDTNGNLEFASGIENIIGTRNSDFILGNAEDNRLEGGAGDDNIDGGAGNDTLLSGVGRDTVNGRDGDDVMVHEGALSTYDGGAGRDWIDLGFYTASVEINLLFAFLGDGKVLSNGMQDWRSPSLSTEIAELTSVEHAAGSAFSDRIFGSAEDNILFGDAGDDVLIGFGGQDLFVGGDGFDIVDYSFDVGVPGISVSLAAKVGVDGYGSTDKFDGIEGIIGSGEVDVITGNDRDNLLVGKAGADVLNGGLGFDTLDYSQDGGSLSIAVDLTTNQGTDSHGFRDQIVDIERVIGTASADLFQGDNGDNTFVGGGGSDSFEGRGGTDTFTGGAGNDTYIIASRGADVIITDFELGADTLNLEDFALDDAEAAISGAKVAVLDEETGKEGVLLSFAEGGSVVLEDVSLDQLGQVTFALPQLARPVLQAASGGGRVQGSERDERLEGQDGADTLEGGDGADILSGGLGDDMLNGGAGRDIASYADANGRIFADLSAGLVTGAQGSDTLESIEGVVGTSLGDTFRGSSNPDFFSGLDGADEFLPGAGADIVETGGGDDIVEGTGEDLDGDRITDFALGDQILLRDVQLNAASTRVLPGSAVFELDADGDGVTDSRFTLEGDYTGQSFEIRSESGSTLIGLAGPGATQLSGARERFVTSDSGENRVFGAADADVILTGGGDDILSGGQGPDVLVAGSGNDILIGGLGTDRMTGGADGDIFMFSAVDFAPGFTADTIVDFTTGEDTIFLGGFGVNDLSQLSFLSFGNGVAINLGETRFIVFEGLTQDDLSAGDFTFSDFDLTYGLVSTTLVHNLSDGRDRFITTDTGANEVRAAGGDDVVIGAGGADVIMGQADSDLLIAGAGNDLVVGGQGSDVMSGGEGADVFEFTLGEETSFAVDTIRDFTIGEDTVNLIGFGIDSTALSFLTLGTGNLALRLQPSHLIQFEGITNTAEFADLENSFVFG